MRVLLLLVLNIKVIKLLKNKLLILAKLISFRRFMGTHESHRWS